jgi:hypothetical protein
MFPKVAKASTATVAPTPYRYTEFHYAKCGYAEYRYAECH